MNSWVSAMLSNYLFFNYPLAPYVRTLQSTLYNHLPHSFHQLYPHFDQYRYLKCVVDAVFEGPDQDNYFMPAVSLVINHFGLNQDQQQFVFNMTMDLISCLDSTLRKLFPPTVIQPSTIVTIGEGYNLSIMVERRLLS